MTIVLYTKDNQTFWAKKYGSSELLIKHLIGDRFVYNESTMNDLKILAKAHGWKINIHLENN